MTSGEPRVPQDEEIRQAWRAAAAESPPTHVDTAILSAAREAARTTERKDAPRPARPWYREWQPMLAVAAVAGLAFALIQVMPRGDGAGMGPRATASGAAESTPPSIAAPQISEAPTRLKVDDTVRKSAGPPPPAGAAPHPPGPAAFDRPGHSANTAAGALERRPPQPAAVAPSPDVADSLMSASPPPTANRERAAAPVDQEGVEATSQAGGTRPAVETRIDRIVTLYRAGDRSRAATELRALRTDVEGIDAQLPASLQAWARTVR